MMLFAVRALDGISIVAIEWYWYRHKIPMLINVRVVGLAIPKWSILLTDRPRIWQWTNVEETAIAFKICTPVDPAAMIKNILLDRVHSGLAYVARITTVKRKHVQVCLRNICLFEAAFVDPDDSNLSCHLDPGIGTQCAWLFGAPSWFDMLVCPVRKLWSYLCWGIDRFKITIDYWLYKLVRQLHI